MFSGYPAPGLEDKNREQNEAPIMHGEMVRILLHHLDTNTGLWGQMGSTQEGESGSAHEATLHNLSSVLDDQGAGSSQLKSANVMPIYKKGQKEDPGKYRPVSLTSVPGKVTEHIIFSVIMQNVQDNQGFRPSQ